MARKFTLHSFQLVYLNPRLLMIYQTIFFIFPLDVLMYTIKESLNTRREISHSPIRTVRENLLFLLPPTPLSVSWYILLLTILKSSLSMIQDCFQLCSSNLTINPSIPYFETMDLSIKKSSNNFPKNLIVSFPQEQGDHSYCQGAQAADIPDMYYSLQLLQLSDPSFIPHPTV